MEVWSLIMFKLLKKIHLGFISNFKYNLPFTFIIVLMCFISVFTVTLIMYKYLGDMIFPILGVSSIVSFISFGISTIINANNNSLR